MFKCNKCDFTAESEKGPKTHMSKTWLRKKQEAHLDYPSVCYLCEKELKTNREIRTHSSVIHVNLCNYLVEDEIGIAVHIGRDHAGNWMWPLCFCWKWPGGIEFTLFHMLNV